MIQAKTNNLAKGTERARRGFTIIETLMALAVLALAVAAPLTLAERSLASVEAANTEITALYLAQEAMEYVRNLRDTNALGNKPSWLDGFDVCIVDPNDNTALGCGVDTLEAKVIPCKDDAKGCLLYQFTSNSTNPKYGVFGHTSSWTETMFRRQVFITEIEPEKKAQVKVTVEWKAGSLGERNVAVESILFNWRKVK